MANSSFHRHSPSTPFLQTGGAGRLLTLFMMGLHFARADELTHYDLFHPVPADQLRELSADRPDKTDTPFTVDAGHFQLEMDFANATYDRATEAGDKTRYASVEFAPVNVKLGLLPNLDAQVVMTTYREEKTTDAVGSTDRRAGFLGVTPRLKVNLVGDDGGLFALALIPFLKLPASSRMLDNGAVEGGLGIPFAFDVPGWDVSFQTTLHCNRNATGTGRHGECDNSISIGHALFGKMSGSVEYFNSLSTEHEAGPIGTVDIWLTYALDHDSRLDGGVYIGVTKPADDWHPWVGMTRRW